MIYLLFYATAPFLWTVGVVCSLLLGILVESKEFKTLSGLTLFLLVFFLSVTDAGRRHFGDWGWRSYSAAFAGWLLVGVAYSFFRWSVLLYKARRRADAVVAEYMALPSSAALEKFDQRDRAFVEWVRLKKNGDYLGPAYSDLVVATTDSDWKYKVVFRPTVNTGQFAAWIVWWPWSLAAYILADAIVDLGEAIGRGLLRVYRWMADRAFGGLE